MWYCKACFTYNEDRDDECYVCSTPRPYDASVETQEKKEEEVPTQPETVTTVPAEQQHSVAVEPEAIAMPSQPFFIEIEEAAGQTESAPDENAAFGTTEGDIIPSSDRQSAGKAFAFDWENWFDANKENAGDEETTVADGDSVAPGYSGNDRPQQPPVTPSTGFSPVREETAQTPAREDDGDDFSSVYENLLRVLENRKDNVEEIRKKREEKKNQEKDRQEEEKEKRKQKKENQQRERERKRAENKAKRSRANDEAVLKFCKLMRLVFFIGTAAAFLSLTAAVLVRLIQGEITDVAAAAEELLYVFEERFIDAFEYNLPRIIEHFEGVLQ